MAKTGEETLRAQEELRRSLEDFSSEQQEERKRREEDNRLAAANEEVRTLRRDKAALQAEMERAGLGEARELQLLKMRLREMDALFGQLEAERSSLARRAAGAEEQLSQLQGAMTQNLARYQKEILRLRSEKQRG